MATDLTSPMMQTLKRMPAAGWVHAKQLSNYRGANVTTVRSLVRRGLLEERAAEGYPQFAVHITEASLAARSAAV